MSTGKSALQQTLRGTRCYMSLACSIGSIGLACGNLFQIPNTTDRISLQRGLFLTSLGFIYFISLTDFCNKYLLETQRGKCIRRKYHLMISDVMEITNKIVSAIQATFSFLVGLIVCKSTCSKSFVYASHFLMEAYGWFGTAYFMYDIWSMYKVHTQTIADKLKLMRLDAPNNRVATTNGKTNGPCDRKKKYELVETKDDGTETLLSNGDSKTLENSGQHYNSAKDADLKRLQQPKGAWGFLKYIVTHPLIMIHHVFIGTFGLLVVTYIRGGGHCIYSYIYMMEFSTPFVSLRSILSTMGLKESRAYVINGLLMLATFFVCRIYMWPHVMWHYSAAVNKSMWEAIVGLPRGCLISISILLLPQIYWFYLMVKGAIKVLFPSTKTIKKVKSQNKNNNLSPIDETFSSIPSMALKELQQNGHKLTNFGLKENIFEKIKEDAVPALTMNGKI